MNKQLVTLTALGALVSSAALADTLIGKIGEHDKQKAVISGVVSAVDDNDEFTVTDNSGSVDVNLTEAKFNISPGQYVTVTGTVDGNELDDARVVILKSSYDTWATSYNKVYSTDYTLAGFDAAFKANSPTHQEKQAESGGSGVGNNNDTMSETTGNTSTEVEPSGGR